MNNASDFIIREGIVTRYDGAGGDIVIPEGVTGILDAAFHSCSKLTGISFPAGVTAIGNYAFGGCNCLTSVTLSEGIKVIGESAFAECTSLTKMVIPATVEKIDNYAFANCTNLQTMAPTSSAAMVVRNISIITRNCSSTSGRRKLSGKLRI